MLQLRIGSEDGESGKANGYGLGKEEDVSTMLLSQNLPALAGVG